MSKRIVLGSTAVVVAGAATVIALLPAPGGTANDRSSAPSRSEAPAVRAKAGPEATQVTVIQPTVEDFLRVTTQPAHVEAHEQTDVYSKASGFVEEVAVDIGDRFTKGQVLANLWIPEMQQERQRKLAGVEQARAAESQAAARIVAAQAQATAAAAKLDEVKSLVAQQEAEVEFRRAEHERISQLVSKGSINPALQDEKANQRRAAESALAAARAGVRTAEANVEVAKAEIIRAQADLEHAQALKKVAEAELKQTEILIQYAEIRAPYEGVVTRRWVHTGDFVASAANGRSEHPLFSVVRVDRLRILVDVPEADSSLIRNGQSATLVVDALKGRTFEGHVTRSAGALNSHTRTLRVEVELDEPDAALRPGMFGELTITLAERSEALLIPARCLRYEGRQPYVLCVDDGLVAKRPVKLGFSDGSRAEIVEGLTEHAPVILEARFPVRPGLAVTPTGAKASGAK
jgi:RND family efflux transporter MFP subunit